MNALSIIKNSYTFFQKQYRVLIINKGYKEYSHYIKMAGGSIKKLSPAEKKQVDSIYKKYGFKYDYHTHELNKAVTGRFDPNIFPEYLFRTKVEYALNNQKMKTAYIDKCYFDKYMPQVPFPKCICKNINGIFMDSNDNILSAADVMKKLAEYESYVIKPSIDTGFGRSVRLVKSSEDVTSIIKQYKKDFIIQELIKQHSFFDSLNTSSVNVIRCNSLFVNGEVHFLSATIRVGAKGSFTDVVSTKDGHGTLLIGITEDGYTKDTAYYQNGQKETDEINGFKFSDFKIPGWEEMIRIIKENHKRLAHFGFIGWDFAINAEGKPVVVEYNVSGPGVLYYQYANGPLLGKYTDEVMNYTVEYFK